MKYNYIGKRINRIDSIDKVTGIGTFVSDIKLPGMLYAKVLRSTKAHALIRSIDINEAIKVEGVVKIIIGKDFPNLFGACVSDQTTMAIDRVRYVGEPVAVVIAEDEYNALEAINKIKVVYEDLSIIMTPIESFNSNDNLVHPKQGEYHRIPSIYAKEETNIFHHFKIRKGNVEDAFKKADFTIENSYVYPPIHHVQLEPHGCVAIYKSNNTLEMWSSTQGPYVVREAISEVLNIPQRKIRVKVPYVGGGFGGKSDVTIEPLVACIARSVPDRPIKLILSREEMIEGTVIGRGIHSIYKTAVNKNGKILAAEIKLYVNGGGYGDYAVNIVNGAGISSAGPYEIPNLKVDSYGLYTNTPPTGACRGYGHPEVHWACERQMDIVAQKLQMDRLQFRFKNILKPGSKNSIGQIMKNHNGRLDLCIDKALEELDGLNKQENTERVVTKGLALFMKCPVMPTNAQSGAILKLTEDGGFTLSVGAIEMGQGCNTALSQIAAEALRVPVEKIEMNSEVDTYTSPYEWQTVASHTTWAVGNAILIAAENIIERVKQAAAEILKVNIEDLIINNEKIYSQKNPKYFITYKDLAKGYLDDKGTALNEPIIGVGNFVPKGLTNLDPETGQGNIAADWTMGCQAVEIEVNKFTGEITINKLITAIDAGKIINPRLAEGQIFGAAIQGLGGALFEQIVFSNQGEIRNKSLTDYKIPGLEDIPKEHKAFFIETLEEGGPFGARGLGEHATVGVAPAIASALHFGLNINFYNLPITSDKILQLLKKGGQ